MVPVRMKTSTKLTTVLVPDSTRDKLKKHCLRHGLKLQTEANKGLLFYLDSLRKKPVSAN